MAWYSWWQAGVASQEACVPLKLTGGGFYHLNGSKFDILQFEDNQIMLVPDCLYENPVIYVNIPTMERLPQFLYQATRQWHMVMDETNTGSRSSTILLSCVAISAAVQLTLLGLLWMCYIDVPIILSLGSLYAVVLAFVVFGLLLKLQEVEFLDHRKSILGPNPYSTGITIASYVAFSLLILAQARVTMDLFERRQERKMAFWTGLLLGISTIVITGIARLGDDENIAIMLMSYLLQLALYIMFIGCVVLRCISAGPMIFYKDLAAMTVLTIVLALGPAVIFIADIAGWWLGRYVNDLLHTMNVVAATMTFFWTRALASVKERDMVERPIGRRIYEAAPKLPTESDEQEIELVPLTEGKLSLFPRGLKPSLPALKPKEN